MFLLVVVLAGTLGLACGCDWFAPSEPAAVAAVPGSGCVGTQVTIVGAGFGASQGASTVTLDGELATIAMWSDGAITARVLLLATPGGASSGTTVVVTVDGVHVGSGSFTVVCGILYFAERGSDFVLCLMNPDGSDATDIASGIGAWTCAAWSPDGTKILFYSRRGGTIILGADKPKLLLNNLEVMVMDADGTDVTNLTNNAATDWFPFWSPDGTRIAFQTDRDGVGEIFAMASDGSDPTNLTNNPNLDGWASWSPDGEKIAFVSDRDGNYEIYVMNADGSGQVRLTNNTEWDAGPTWSPDGTRIAFESHRDGEYRIYVMDADGTDQTMLTRESSGYPVWLESRWAAVRP